MKTILTLLLLLVSYMYGIGQSTVVDYTIIGNESSEYSTDLDTLADYLYLVGNTNECGSNDGFIIKYKDDSIYKRTIVGTESIDIIESVETTTTDTLFVAGFTNRNNDYNVFLAKLDTQLNIITTKELAIDDWNFCYDIAINNTNVLGVGKTHNGIDYDAFIFKVDSNLDTVWTRSLMISEDQQLNKVIAYNDSVFIACGYTEIDGLEKDIYLISFNANTGDTIWTTHIGGVNDDFCNSIIKTIDGGIAGFATTSSYTSSNEDTFLFKANNLGVFLWSNLHQVQSSNNTLNENGLDLVELQNGDLIVASSTESFGNTGVKSTMIMKTNSSGNWLNGYIYDGGSDDFPTAMVKINDTSIFVSGIANSNTFGYSDSYLLNINIVDNLNTENIVSKELVHLCYVGVEEGKEVVPELFIFPNPIKNQFQIKSNNIDLVTLNVYNLIGSKLHTIHTTTNTFIEFPSYLPKGAYIIEVNDEEIIKYYKVIYAK